jgi:predicted unusual protein kinase regulating ubiquinone biosynthesis (AarF/ABC1/UbiB family)
LLLLLQAMMAALLHWSQGNWLALAGDMQLMGLLKPTTDLQELALDLQQRFTQLYAASTQQQQQQQQEPAVSVDSSLKSYTNSSSSSSACSVSTTTGTQTGAAAAATAAGASISGQPSMLLLQRAGAIGFAEFAGVIAGLALKYRFELPPYYTLVIRSLTTLEGFALLVEPSARQNIAQTAVKVGIPQATVWKLHAECLQCVGHADQHGCVCL